MAIQSKRFGWLRLPTGWEQFQAWQEKRRTLREDFENSRSIAAAGFGAACSAQIQGSAALAGQAALSRIQAASKNRLDKRA